MAEEIKDKREEKPEGIRGEGQRPQGRMTQGQRALGWKVTDEEIDRVIKKLEEGWQF